MSTHNHNNAYGRISEQSIITVQCKHDQKHLNNLANAKNSGAAQYEIPITSEIGTLRIDAGDIVFRVGRGSTGRAALSGGPYVPVVSSTRGLFVPEGRIPRDLDKDDKEAVRAAVADEIIPIGVALEGTNPLSEDETMVHTQITVQVGGSTTVRNTGTEIIRPGDTLLWDLFRYNELQDARNLNLKQRNGQNDHKVPLKIVPLRSAASSFGIAMHRAFAAKRQHNDEPAARYQTSADKFAHKVLDAMFEFYQLYDNAGRNASKQEHFNAIKDTHGPDADKKQAAFVSSIVEAVTVMQNELKRREIGRALSYAKPGADIDVLLG